LQEFTTAFFIEVSLPHGKYRYQVIPYDFFNLPVPVTEWMDFEIQRSVLNPDEPESKNKIAIPGPEPETTMENKFDIYLGLAWIPLIPAYGGNELFGENLSSYGAGLRLAVFSAEQKSFKFGMEGSASWRISMVDQPVQSLTFDLNVVACLLDGKTALNYRIGAGVSLGIDTSQESAGGHANFGLSFLWLPLKYLYMELGMEYVQFFSNSGFLCPSVGLGFRF